MRRVELVDVLLPVLLLLDDDAGGVAWKARKTFDFFCGKKFHRPWDV